MPSGTDRLKSLALAFLTVSLVWPAAAADDAWIVHTSNERDGMTVSVDAPRGWTVEFNGAQLVLKSPDTAFADGARGTTTLVTNFHKIDPKHGDPWGSTAVDSVPKRLAKTLKDEDKHYPLPHEPLGKTERTIDGQKAWSVAYARQSRFHACTGVPKPNPQRYRIDAFIKYGFYVETRVQACDQRLLDRHRPALRRMIGSVRFGPLTPTVDADGRAWTVFDSGKVRLSDQKGFVYDVTVKGEVPPGWTWRVADATAAGRGREGGRLVLDLRAPAGGGAMRIWAQGLPIRPHDLSAYLATAEAAYVAEVLPAFTKTPPEETSLPRLAWIPRDRNRHWGGSEKIYLRTYAGTAQSGDRVTIDVYTFAAPTAVYNVFVVAVDAQISALRGTAEAILRELRIQACRVIGPGYGCGG